MIFITKKAFENEMYNRINEANFHARMEDEIYKLKDEVRELRYKVESLEQSIRQPVPVNPTPIVSPIPNWTGTPITTCTTAEAEK